MVGQVNSFTTRFKASAVTTEWNAVAYCTLNSLRRAGFETNRYGGDIYMKSSFPKRYKSIWIVFMKMTFFYLDPYILLIFNLSC